MDHSSIQTFSDVSTKKLSLPPPLIRISHQQWTETEVSQYIGEDIDGDASKPHNYNFLNAQERQITY